MALFTSITSVQLPTTLQAEEASGRCPAFEIAFEADGEVPFPQVLLREGGREHIFCGSRVRRLPGHRFLVPVPAGELPVGDFEVQVEGCRTERLGDARPEDWSKAFARLRVTPAKRSTAVQGGQSASAVRVHFGIHKHLHQPYYRAAERRHWDGEKESIFGTRRGPYTSFVPTAVRQYASGALPHAGLSLSISGSLIEQLDRCAEEGLCGGTFANWSADLRAMSSERTALGHPRMEVTAFGHFHPLMPLVPARDIVRQIEMHRSLVQRVLGAQPSKILFPPETAFHVRMIPALRQAGIEAVIYDSIHRYRSCRDYPYAGVTEGMLPPNQAEQENAPVHDWLQLQNVWAGSKISPSLLRPEHIRHEAPDGSVETIIGVPAERYIGNEDARGGFGALQYPSVLGQVWAKVVEDGSYDPAHPPFFLLHSDGDNHGGGADSYYGHNTAQLVQWLHEDPRFELTSVADYLERFPPDRQRAVHLEPGSWSGADNGDPQFAKWFSRYHEPYSPDLNSWAVLTALQNAVHALEDAQPNAQPLGAMQRLLLTAETSCYWYWTGQDVWDRQVTEAANLALELGESQLRQLQDRTGPTLFPPWITPENPGGKAWGNGRLLDAPREATLHTFVYDLSGLKRVQVVLRSSKGEQRLDLRDLGAYPSRTGARISANYFRLALPVGLGLVHYYLEAEDRRGNVSQGALERIFLP